MAIESTLGEEDVAAIKGMLEPFTAAVMSGDVDSWLAQYTEDIVLMPPHSPPLVGREAVRKWAEALPPVIAFTGTFDEIVGHGDMAIVRGQYQMTFDIPDLPEPFQDTGSYLEIRTRQADGTWLLARDIFNTDLPAPE